MDISIEDVDDWKANVSIAKVYNGRGSKGTKFQKLALRNCAVAKIFNSNPIIKVT